MLVSDGLQHLTPKMNFSGFAGETDSYVTSLAYGEEAILVVRGRTSQGPKLTSALAVTVSPDELQTFIATIREGYVPLTTEPPAHIRLDDFKISGRSTKFGPDQTVKGLFLAPTLVHGELFGSDESPPPSSTVQCLGGISVLSDAAGDYPRLQILMPAITYGNFDQAWADTWREPQP